MTIWDRVGPREDERGLAGRTAGALWLSVYPMLLISMVLPGSDRDYAELLVLLTFPAAAWGVACLQVVPWERVKTPLYFHVPAILALPYIAVLVASTGVASSPFALTSLMLIAFCSYFFPPRVAIPYLIGCLAVTALPLLYEPGAIDDGLLSQVWVSLVVFGSVAGVIMVGKRQLLALRDAEHELSQRDELTGLANRRALTEVLERHVGGKRESDALGLLLVDLDDFKEANTLYGLPGGDRVLRMVADELRKLARDDDLVVRLGGDEFAVVGRHASPEGMGRLAERIVDGVKRTGRKLDMPGFDLTASAGWALYPQNGKTVDELVAATDISLRAAKMSGKGRAQAPLEWEAETAVE